jgi:hypothetical protein
VARASSKAWIARPMASAASLRSDASTCLRNRSSRSGARARARARAWARESPVGPRPTGS